MRNDPFYIKQGDTRPYLRRTLKDADGTAIDLTSATVRFHMNSGDQSIVDAAATVITAASGIVEYRWQSGDTDIVGLHKAEFEITLSDATVLTVPNDTDIEVHVAAQKA
jgi:hypothetical protein